MLGLEKDSSFAAKVIFIDNLLVIAAE